jgi:tetratricopeptide (TPR) repeat protein
MFSPRHRLAATSVVALSLFSYTMYGSSAVSTQASRQATRQSLQQSTFSHDDEREQAVKLYQAGDAAGAAKALQAFVKKQKNDIHAWHYLGLALKQQGKPDDARKAHEQAAKLGVKLIDNQVEGLSEANELLARILPLQGQLSEAADSAALYLELSLKPSKSKVTEWRGREELLRGYVELVNELKANRVYKPKDVTTKARILDKPSPLYTEEARKNQVTGTVTLLLILSADGQLRGFIPIDTLPYGLTEESIKAARGIRFTPAIKDGQSVSQFLKVEYNFNIY